MSTINSYMTEHECESYIFDLNCQVELNKISLMIEAVCNKLDSDYLLAEKKVMMENGIYEVGGLCVIPKYQGKESGTSAIEFIKKYYDDWNKFTLITPMDKSENIRFYTEKNVVLIYNLLKWMEM